MPCGIRARKNLFDVLGIDEFRNFQDFVHLDEVGIRDIVEVNDVFGVASIAKGAFGELIDVVARLHFVLVVQTHDEKTAAFHLGISF